MCLRDAEYRPAQGAACVCQERGSPAAVLRKGLAASRDEQAVLRDAVTEGEQGRVLAGSAAASASGPGIRKAV